MIHEEEVKECLKEHGYVIQDPVGNGGFATVFTCIKTKFNQVYCVKLMELKTENKTLPDTFNIEIESLIKVIHPNVVCIYDYFTSPNMLYIILEYCTGGSLDRLIKDEKRIEPQSRLFLMCKQIINALKVVHSLGIAHRDIKPLNILLDSHKRPKIADFGLAQNISKNELSERFSGSLPFKSPEILNLKPYDPFLADVWALGVTFYMMCAGTLPWQATTLEEWKSLVMYGPSNFPPGTNVQFQRAVKKMLEPKVNERITIEELANLPIFLEAEVPVVRQNSKQYMNTSNRDFETKSSPLFQRMPGLVRNIPKNQPFSSTDTKNSALNTAADCVVDINLSASNKLHTSQTHHTSTCSRPITPSNQKSNSSQQQQLLHQQQQQQQQHQQQQQQYQQQCAKRPTMSHATISKPMVNPVIGSAGAAPNLHVKNANTAVFTWKRRCSKVTKLINFTFNENDKKNAESNPNNMETVPDIAE